MTDLASTDKSIKNKKIRQRKNLILVFGICISLVVVSSFFPFPETGLTNGQKSMEKAPKIHELDSTVLINHNRKIHHNFLASYLLQESSLERKSQVSAKRNSLFLNPSVHFIIPIRQLFGRN